MARHTSIRAKRYVVSLYPNEAARMKDYGQGVLSRGIRRSWRARSTAWRKLLDQLVLDLQEAYDLEKDVAPYISALTKHLEGGPKPTRMDDIVSFDGPPLESN